MYTFQIKMEYFQWEMNKHKLTNPWSDPICCGKQNNFHFPWLNPNCILLFFLIKELDKDEDVEVTRDRDGDLWWKQHNTKVIPSVQHK